MAQVSIGQVKNLEELARGLLSVREALESACREQVAKAESKSVEASEELQQSENMLESAMQAEMEAQQAVADARQNLESAEATLSAAESALSACVAQPDDEDGRSPDCSSEESEVAVAAAAVR